MTNNEAPAVTDRRYSYAEAMQVAEALVRQLEPCCERIVIAGSLLRKKSEVGDIELLYIPRLSGKAEGHLFDPKDLAEERIEQLENGVLCRRKDARGRETFGKKNKLMVHKPTGIPVDLFATTKQNWWVSLVIRTGGKETNLRLTSRANELGYSLNAYGCGFTRLSDGKVFEMTSEEAIFEFVGLPCPSPEMRS